MTVWVTIKKKSPFRSYPFKILDTPLYKVKFRKISERTKRKTNYWTTILPCLSFLYECIVFIWTTIYGRTTSNPIQENKYFATLLDCLTLKWLLCTRQSNFFQMNKMCTQTTTPAQLLGLSFFFHQPQIALNKYLPINQYS